MKVPNSIIEKMKKIGVEHTVEVIELLKETYDLGYEDGAESEYNKMTK